MMMIMMMMMMMMMMMNFFNGMIALRTVGSCISREDYREEDPPS